MTARLRPAGALVLIDDAADAAVRLGPAIGLLWLTALPSRLLLSLVCARLVELGPKATSYGDSFTRLAYATLGAWLLSLWGRQVFVRSCRRALESEQPPPSPLLRIPLPEFAGYVFSALVIETLFWALLLTLVAPLALLAAAGLAAAASPRERAGLVNPFRAIGESMGSLSVLLRLAALFALALALAALNLHLLFAAGLWLAAGLAAIDGAAWSAVLSPFNPLYGILLVAGATLLIEPFWLAALTGHVERARSRKSGDDLRQWFAAIKART